MKINTKIVNNAYQASLNIKEGLKHKNTNEALKQEHTDKIVMSENGVMASLVSQASKKVIDEVNANYSNEKLYALKEAINNGTYKVDEDKLVNAMLTRVWEA